MSGGAHHDAAERFDPDKVRVERDSVPTNLKFTFALGVSRPYTLLGLLCQSLSQADGDLKAVASAMYRFQIGQLCGEVFPLPEKVNEVCGRVAAQTKKTFELFGLARVQVSEVEAGTSAQDLNSAVAMSLLHLSFSALMVVSVFLRRRWPYKRAQNEVIIETRSSAQVCSASQQAAQPGADFILGANPRYSQRRSVQGFTPSCFAASVSLHLCSTNHSMARIAKLPRISYYAS